MITLSHTRPYIRVVPDVMKPFVKAGKVDDIFRPRVLANGIFATSTGYGVSFGIGGIDSEGLDRKTLDHLAKQIAIANRMLPEDCMVFEYLITANNDELPARPITQAVVREQAQERAAFLKANAKFSSVRLIVTLYIPGKVAEEAEEFTENSRSALRKIQNAALLYDQHLRMLLIQRLTPDQLVQTYSYLLNLDRSLMTHKAAKPGQPPKKLGRSHIGLEGDYLRVGKQYCQVLSLVERPRGTRPNLWGALLSVDCEMVFCSVWQRQAGQSARSKAVAVENAIGMAGEDLWSAAVGGYTPAAPPPRRASAIAQEKNVEKVGDILSDLDGRHYYGHYSLFGLVHSRDRERIEAALPRIQNIFSDPAEAALLEEKRGVISAYVSFFPGQQYNVRKHWMRGDHKANLSFVYSPFLGHAWSEDFHDEYTLAYETRQGTPFFLMPFVNGNGNTTVLGGPGRGKSLNTNAIFTSALKYGTPKNPMKTFIFDQGGSFESNVIAHGGAVTHLGLKYPRLNFFCVEPTKENIHAVSQMIRLLLNKSGIAVGNDDQDAIDKGVERLFDVPAELRRLNHLVLPPNLRKGLKRWTEGGMYGSIFDNVEDDLQFHDLQLFDFGSLGDKHNDLLEVEMSWILLLCQNVVRDKKNLGVPKHIVIDELWKWVGLLPVVSFVLETLKADRKNLAWATLITHSLEDLGSYAPLIKSACPNTIFLGGAFDRDLYAKHFRLNARELDELESLGDRELAIKVDGEPFVAGGNGYFKVLRMNMDPAAYARATTKPSERAMRERLISELGQDEGMNRLKEIAAAYRSGR
jgi:type IV secretion system protein VirB4